jgi:hypothetical protein
MSTIALGSVLLAACAPTLLTASIWSIAGLSMQSAHALTMYIAAMDSVMSTIVPTDTRRNGFNLNDVDALQHELTDAQEEIFKTLNAAIREGKNMQEAFALINPALVKQIQPVASSAFGHIRSIMESSDPGLLKLRCLMTPCLNPTTNVVEWVKHEHVSAFTEKNAKNNKSRNMLSMSGFVPESCLGDCEVELYDPWVLITHPTVNSNDCEDVEALSNWLHDNAKLLRSRADALATALISDNCPHIARLQHRLYHNPKYLHGFGLDEDDEADVMKALNIGGGRSMCTIS